MRRGLSNLTPEEVGEFLADVPDYSERKAAILRDRAEGYSLGDLADSYGVSEQRIHDICLEVREHQLYLRLKRL